MYGAVTVGTSATLLSTTEHDDRDGSAIAVKNPASNTVTVYLGDDAGVTTATGLPLDPGDSYCADLDRGSKLYAIAASATPVRCLQTGV